MNFLCCEVIESFLLFGSRDMVNFRGTLCCPSVQVSKTMLEDRGELGDNKDNIRPVLIGSVGEIQ